MEQQSDESKVVKRINSVVEFIKRIGRLKNKINERMEGKYSPKLIALIVTAIAALLIMLMLFIPNYLGVADDGSISRVMSSAGVYYTQTEVSDIYNNYFVKKYSNVLSGYQVKDNYLNSQVLLLRAAVYFDDVITKDKYFDIRFLAILYFLLFVPALYLLVKQACLRVKKFSEGIIIGFSGTLIFADVAYVTYFNSFYPEAIWFICLMYCVAAGLSFQTGRSAFGDFGSMVIIVIAGTVLVTSRNQTAFIGILFAVFCLKIMFVRRHWMWNVICVITAFFFSFLAIFCMINMDSDFDEISKFHAMTRGVLFESDNPQKALAEFGINPSYEMLTDVSSYDYLPLVQATDSVLKEEFLDKYSAVDIAAYYVRHPSAFFSMTDVAIKSCFGIRREYCGNYEKSAGMPKRARSIFWGAWSTFKNNSAPKTIGFLIVLVAAVFMLFSKGYSIRPYENRRSTVFLDMMMVVLFVCLSQAAITIVNSGDAEMIQHCFLISFGIDIMIYIVFAEVVHKINIF